MKSKSISPKISSFQWGQITVGNKTYKDAKLYPGGSCAWDWNETGTRHAPGIQPADVQKLLDNDAKTIILSKGINLRLQTAPETKEMLDQRDCDYFILQSEEAVEKYNELCNAEPVGALIHSTC